MVSEISESEIRDKLAKQYGGDNADRNLIRSNLPDGNGAVGSIVYSLEGTPPKGYAIYVPELRLLSLYDPRGRRFRKIGDTRVIEAEGRSKVRKWDVGGFFRAMLDRELVSSYVLQHGGSICNACDLPKTANTAVETRQFTIDGENSSAVLCEGCYQKIRDIEETETTG